MKYDKGKHNELIQIIKYKIYQKLKENQQQLQNIYKNRQNVAIEMWIQNIKIIDILISIIYELLP